MMTCKEIVNKLDEYTVGQYKAKRAVSIALRNRFRRIKYEPRHLTVTHVFASNEAQGLQLPQGE